MTIDRPFFAKFSTACTEGMRRVQFRVACPCWWCRLVARLGF